MREERGRRKGRREREREGERELIVSSGAHAFELYRMTEKFDIGWF